MSKTWTQEQIFNLAPDENTANRGERLAKSPQKWINCKQHEHLIWGECKGSGSSNYLIQVDLNIPRYACSCPVRKLPCKHILGLMFFHLNVETAFVSAPLPRGLEKWVQPKAEVSSPIATDIELDGALNAQIEKARIAKEKRWLKRRRLMQGGIDELEQWLLDMVRQGLANVPVDTVDYWNQIAFKMVDAQLPGISTYLKECHQMVRKNTNWTNLLLSRIGYLYLWIESFNKLDSLPAELQDDLLTSLGKNKRKAEVIEQGCFISDTWLVTGQILDVDVEGRNRRKVWLYGIESGQYALLLDFAFGNMPFERNYKIGTCFTDQLAFYSKNLKLRAVTQMPVFSDAITVLPEALAWEDVLLAYAKAKGTNPWGGGIPVAIAACTPIWSEEKLSLNVGETAIKCKKIPMHAVWNLLAISGGATITIFGIWDGGEFAPLSLFDAGSIYVIS